MRTFRSDGVMLSSVQNYKGGYMAGQQQAWQATLDYYRNGTIFSVQPTQEDMWVGGILPKVGQFGSTLISMYSPEVLATAVFGIKTTHAHFRQDAFDEYHVHMAEEGFGWLVGRQDDAFVALYSWQLGYWEPENITEEGIVYRDFVSEGVQNVYICEVGNLKLNGSFEDFVQNVVTSTVQVNLAYNDSLLECLVDNGCLDSIPALIGCLLDTCSSSSEELFRKELQTAVDHSDDQQIFSLVAQRVNNIRHSDVDVVYVRNSTIFEIGWNSNFIVDGNDISTDDFQRYSNRFTSMDWGARSIDIKTETSNLFMDFDTLSIVET
ncbi:uncharacterized protein LOC111702378 [Eurytemora carolleeae]|uniref:uncharacterized protein LOC111702378 n=1 Tax=Eurytemora carolleeae TaxID=1294199 RepID=UPI000C78D5F5|nr:uncharacterized protein LOC111702378 [Eurytemora carolleeae]|eukprot:XP_023329813.1 uncharacterized protein LOC111702378 [Eurytemora affinis]